MTGGEALIASLDVPEVDDRHVLATAILTHVSDAPLTMVQYNPALDAFKTRYRRYVKICYDRKHLWITAERVAE